MKDKYDSKCKFFSFRFRKDTDKKYIEFLDSCENKTDFLRKVIDHYIEYVGGFECETKAKKF